MKLYVSIALTVLLSMPIGCKPNSSGTESETQGLTRDKVKNGQHKPARTQNAQGKNN